jgi:cell division protein FtsQ
MDGRAHAAHATKVKSRRVAPVSVPHWPAAAPRWTRMVRRWGTTLINLNVPRGAGATAVALFMLATVSYGVVRGEHQGDVAANVQDICDAVANTLGFRISEVALAGEHELPRQKILDIAGITETSSLVFLDAAQTRARLVSNPWIAEATVLKLYPGRLRIEIKERKPFALWQKDGRVHLIAEDGTVLESFVPQRYAALPMVVGAGAERAAPALIELIKRFPSIATQVQASVLVAERRWTLHLKNGVEVLLPEQAPDKALAVLTDLERAKQLLTRDITAVDLRLPDRVTVRQSDAAFAARDAALKAAEKAKKKVAGKGGEA